MDRHTGHSTWTAVNRLPAVPVSTLPSRSFARSRHPRSLDSHGTPSFDLQLTRSLTANANFSQATPFDNRTRDDRNQGNVTSDDATRRHSQHEDYATPIPRAHHDSVVYQPSTSTSAPRKINGITLISTSQMPLQFRIVFPHSTFNAIQSKCFPTIFETDDNFVLASPTGSGKTVVLELAICRLAMTAPNGSYKVIYQAPTKSLCAERKRDWEQKFARLGLTCAELTGDTNGKDMSAVQQADIIVTTPEKWDSVTRKLHDQRRLVELIRLFLIDEAHILNSDRGATLEAIVSRMRAVGRNVRFVALSATIPNSHDISRWLGKDGSHPTVPAPREHFGEEFRPVRLVRHVCGYRATNDFILEKMLDERLPDIISRYSRARPILIFCFTRDSCVKTAKRLSTWWTGQHSTDRKWHAPNRCIAVADRDLSETVSSAVAYHHSGVSLGDRQAIERGYLDGNINVICCTSTLAVGVNLPCHMVIVKNTVTYQTSSRSSREYTDLEMMQMLGRAGRPQFDDSAVAVVMTRLEKVQHYERLNSGQEIIESFLHRNLVEHLNAEIGLKTITDLASAKLWLSGTFLCTRLRDNPGHYQIEGDCPNMSLDDRLARMCETGIKELAEQDLVNSDQTLQCTEYGDIMTRFYIQFETMKLFMALPRESKLSEILSAICNATEFGDIRLRAGERTAYRDLNRNMSIKFQIPVNLDAAAHKVSLIIQAVLADLDNFTDAKHRQEFTAAKIQIFQHIHRLIRCIIDCRIYSKDPVSVRNALMLARSFAAEVWDDSPLHMKQLDGIGPVAVRKLVGAGMKTIDDIEATEPHKLEMILGRNPPFGSATQSKARMFPRPFLTLEAVGKPVIRAADGVTLQIKAHIAFDNPRIPDVFNRKPVFVCMMVETSDKQMLHFARISASKLGEGQDISFSAKLTNATQTINAYVMCDEIAGTSRHVALNPALSASLFPTPRTSTQSGLKKASTTNVHAKNKERCDEYDECGLMDEDLEDLALGGYTDIDDLHGDRQNVLIAGSRKVVDNAPPVQLPNGRWACNHHCKDKTKCKHLCCREGLEKRPKTVKPSATKTGVTVKSGNNQSHIKFAATQASNHKQGRHADSTKASTGVNKWTGLLTPSSNSLGKRQRIQDVDSPSEAEHNDVRTIVIDSDNEMLEVESLDLTGLAKPGSEDCTIKRATADMNDPWSEIMSDGMDSAALDMFGDFMSGAQRIETDDWPVDLCDKMPTRDQVQQQTTAKHDALSPRSDIWCEDFFEPFQSQVPLVATQNFNHSGVTTVPVRDTMGHEKASLFERLPIAKSKIDQDDDEMEKWFNAEFGTERFEYIR